jgi:hypothetical protein
MFVPRSRVRGIWIVSIMTLLLTVFIPGLFVLAFIRGSYGWDLGADLFLYSFIILFLLGMGVICCIKRKLAGVSRPAELALRAAGIFICLMLVYSCIGFLSVRVQDLSHGPAYGAGDVEIMETQPGRYGTRYYITIRNCRYRVTDRVWFNTLTVGEKIEFQYTPQSRLAYPVVK